MRWKKKTVNKTFSAFSILAALCLPIAGAGAADHLARAMLKSPEGESRGKVVVQAGAGGLKILADLKNLPEGTHAFHLHANPACGGDFSAAGGHYNPDNRPHGILAAEQFHLGDLPNIHIGETGQLKTEFFIRGLTLSAEFPPPGTVIIHAGGDDYVSQPTGAAGGRIACGVIEW